LDAPTTAITCCALNSSISLFVVIMTLLVID
jgi:hypothetical protein